MANMICLYIWGVYSAKHIAYQHKNKNDGDGEEDDNNDNPDIKNLATKKLHSI